MRLLQLWNERRLLARCIAAGLLFGIILAIALPTRYEASVQLMPPDNQGGSGLAMMAALAGNGLGAMAGDLLGIKSSADQFVAILHSRTAASDLVQKFDLKKGYGERFEEDARAKLAENTRISLDRKSGMVSITVTDRDPRRAAALAQGYIEELDHLVASLSTSSAHRERLFLEDRLKAVKQDLDQAAQSFSQFASRNSAIDITEQAKAMVQSAAVLQGELIAAESEVSGLEQIYSANNVRVRSVQARISELREQLQKLSGTTDVDAAKDEGKQLYPSLRQLPILGVTYSDLYRRTKIQEAVFETLTKEYELAKVQEAKEIPSVKVLDAAEIPRRKSFPPRTLITLLCGFFACAFGGVFILVRESWRRLASDSPTRLLAGAVSDTLQAKMRWTPPNGSRVHAVTHQMWRLFARKPDVPR
jgi:uncharacterized protein involved in exopolysaccharide biosynthesis